MRRKFTSAADVIRSGFAEQVLSTRRHGDRVLRSSRLEDKIYREHHEVDQETRDIEQYAQTQLSTFPALARDIFQSFYAFRQRPVDDTELSALARQFNKAILEEMMASDDFAAAKAACSGRELPAYDAARDFIGSIAGNLGELLHCAEGSRGVKDVLDRQEKQLDRRMEELRQLLQEAQPADMTPAQEKRLLKKANEAADKQQQVECLGNMVRENMLQSHAALSAAVSQAMHAARETAEETAAVIQAWGSDPADPACTPINREILARVQVSPLLQKVTKELGRMRELASKAFKSGYTYGRGETYDLECGNDLQRVIGSEFALLAAEETRPLFFRKYQAKALKQYRHREPVKKGKGDMIFCRDESDSVSEDQMAWGKAVALTMLGIAAREGRKFAFIHFSSVSSVKTELFIPGQYGPIEMLVAAELVLGGGTDFEAPLTEALRVIYQEGFRKADIIFATDGECEISNAFAEQFKTRQAALGLTVTGILMDQGSAFRFSLESFCSKVYRTSEMGQDDIAAALVGKEL